MLVGTGQATGTILPELLKRNLSLAVVEEDRVGGSCVNWGCTPTKTLVASARVAHMVRRSTDFGIRVQKMQTDFVRVMEPFNRIRNDASSGFRKWLEADCDFYPNRGRFLDEHTIAVGESMIRGETIIIHTGARSRKPEIAGIDTIPWLDNRGILDLKELPEHLLIVGGSYIGLEFGQAFRRFGSRVTLFEQGTHLIFREDPDVSSIAQEILEGEGLEFHLNSVPRSVKPAGEKIILRYTQGKEEHQITGTHILMATGRIPSSDGLNLPAAGIEKGIDALAGTMPMSAVSRAKEKAETSGTIKVVVEKSSGKLLGATIFGVGGDEVIGMLALAIQAGLPYSVLQDTVIPHPTVEEMVPWLFGNLEPVRRKEAEIQRE